MEECSVLCKISNIMKISFQKCPACYPQVVFACALCHIGFLCFWHTTFWGAKA